jgi:hypothetical protein
LTTYFDPRILARVLAFVGDSTMTRDVPAPASEGAEAVRDRPEVFCRGALEALFVPVVFFPAEEVFLPVPEDGGFFPEGGALFAAPAGTDFPAAIFFAPAGEVFFPPEERAVTAAAVFSEGGRGAVSGAVISFFPSFAMEPSQQIQQLEGYIFSEGLPGISKDRSSRRASTMASKRGASTAEFFMAPRDTAS